MTIPLWEILSMLMAAYGDGNDVRSNTQPPRFSQQPPSLLLSAAERDSLLSGFGGAWLPVGYG